jgi:adenosylhomocysteine nucleosidase
MNGPANLKSRPVFVAALRREIDAVVSKAGWISRPTDAGNGIYLFEHEEAIVACAGMGAQRALLAVEAALALGPASELISVGWAGGCDPDMGVGDVIEMDTVIDVKTGERFFSDVKRNSDKNRDRPGGLRVLVTVSEPATVKEKGRLRDSYNATAVDMEAASVARAARARGVGFSALKAISDDAQFELPDVARFVTAQGQFREAAFGFHVVSRPSLWRPVMTMAKGSKLAGERLQLAIEKRMEVCRDPK